MTDGLGGGEPGTPNATHRFLASPLSHLATLVIGFLLGVFLMVVLRSELTHLRQQAVKFGIIMGISVSLFLMLYPLYRGLSRSLMASFGPEQGRALLNLVNFVIFTCGVLLFVMAGLYFVALA